MSHPAFDHLLPWGEEEYLALGRTMGLVELVNDGLWINPSPNNFHQEIACSIRCALRQPATEAGLKMLIQSNVRLGVGTIVNPDLAVSATAGRAALVNDAAGLRLIGEVTTAQSAITDRELKPRLYAAAGIPWFLLVEADDTDLSVTLRLHRLEGGAYVEHAVAGPGETLVSEQPFRIELDTGALAAAGPRRLLSSRRSAAGRLRGAPSIDKYRPQVINS